MISINLSFQIYKCWELNIDIFIHSFCIALPGCRWVIVSPTGPTMDSRPSSSSKVRTLAYMPVVEVQGYNAHNKLQVGQEQSTIELFLCCSHSIGLIGGDTIVASPSTVAWVEVSGGGGEVELAINGCACVRHFLSVWRPKRKMCQRIRCRGQCETHVNKCRSLSFQIQSRILLFLFIDFFWLLFNLEEEAEWFHLADLVGGIISENMPFLRYTRLVKMSNSLCCQVVHVPLFGRLAWTADVAPPQPTGRMASSGSVVDRFVGHVEIGVCSSSVHHPQLLQVLWLSKWAAIDDCRCRHSTTFPRHLATG